MSAELRTQKVRVRVPATSANLGPGFDCFGLALALFDELELTVAQHGLEVSIEGQGADTLARDESHLVVRSIAAGFAEAGVALPGLRLSCHNAIPQGRGLGSSSAAIVGGLGLARAVLAGGDELLPDATLLEIATSIEGHPDNVAPALLGGFTIAWTEGGDGSDGGDQNSPDRGRAIRLEPHPDLIPVVAIPGDQLATQRARELLPASVPLQDAVFTAGRAALLVEAMTHRPDLLFQATADRLHQDYRRFAYPDSFALVLALRARKIPAAISGAGPTVLALCSSQTECSSQLEVAAVAATAHEAAGDFAVRELLVSAVGLTVQT